MHLGALGFVEIRPGRQQQLVQAGVRPKFVIPGTVGLAGRGEHLIFHRSASPETAVKGFCIQILDQ
jgi:hypothetical protein